MKICLCEYLQLVPDCVPQIEALEGYDETYLACYDHNISDLEGIQYVCANNGGLNSLDISNNPIQSLSPIASHSNLTQLSFGGSVGSDVSLDQILALSESLTSLQ
ncbi:hypothetical protein ADUPG1_013909, partial [Aduncisulcus paluster]